MFWAFDDSNQNLPKNHEFEDSCQEFADLWQVRTGRSAGGRTDARTGYFMSLPTQKAPSGQPIRGSKTMLWADCWAKTYALKDFPGLWNNRSKPLVLSPLFFHRNGARGGDKTQGLSDYTIPEHNQLVFPWKAMDYVLILSCDYAHHEYGVVCTNR